MKEEPISFEVAKLAKEKGFDEYGQDYYNARGQGFWYKNQIKNNTYGIHNLYCTRPTQSLLQRWIREKHGLYAYVDWENMEVVIVDYKNHGGLCLLRQCSYDFCTDNEEGELLDTLLLEALKLIEI